MKRKDEDDEFPSNLDKKVDSSDNGIF